MSLTLQQLHEVVTGAGVPDVNGLPLRALVASIAMEESGGNPLVRGDRGKSYGLLQVHKPDWPVIAAAVERTMDSPASPKAIAGAQVRLARPILEAASRLAVSTANELASRGFSVGPRELLLLIDAAWQASPRRIANWMERTQTGDPAEINASVSPGRSQRVLDRVTELEGSGSVTTSGIASFLGIIGLAGLLLWAMSHWTEE